MAVRSRSRSGSRSKRGRGKGSSRNRPGRTRSRSRSRSRSRGNTRRRSSGSRRRQVPRRGGGGGGGTYATSAGLDYGGSTYGMNPYASPGALYGGNGEAQTQQELQQAQDRAVESDESIRQLSQNISDVIADLRKKLKETVAAQEKVEGKAGGSGGIHYGGFHRSSFLNKLRRR